MSYKTILVPLPDAERMHQVLEPAIMLARQQNAHLVGMSVLPTIVIIPGSQYGAAEVIEQHRIIYKEKMAALRAAFEEMTSRHAFTSEWLHVDAGYETITDVVARHARSVDLVVVLQDDSGSVYLGSVEDPEQLVMECGRPAFIVPKAGNPKVPPKRIVVAWNGRREAARAVFDALPLLKAAESVAVLWVDPQDEGGAAGDLPGIDICRALARHGVKCDVTQNIRPNMDVGVTLIEAVKANAADLLVMGCYGHSRFREFIAGGATRFIIRNMTTPVLMSH